MISLAELKKCLNQVAPQQQSSRNRTARNRRRRQRRRQRQAPNSTPATFGAAQVVPIGTGRNGRRRRRNRQGVAAGPAQGDVVLSRSELLVTIKTNETKAASGSVALAPQKFPWLSNVSKAFELLKWTKAIIEYRPLVGTMKDGAVAVGFDWGSASASLLKKLQALDRASVLACTPNADGPVWQRIAQINLPSSRLQTRLWYDVLSTGTDSFDTAPGQILYYATGEASSEIGELWVHYTVHLSGTRKV